MSILIPEAVAQTAQGGGAAGSPWPTLIMFGGLFAIMYFMMIRPQRKRQKEHQQLVDSLAKGNEVVMTSGMLGKVTDVDEAYVSIDAGDGVNLKFQKMSVHAVLPKGTIKSI